MAADCGWMQARVGRRFASRCRSQSSSNMSDRLHVALIDDDAAVLDALRYYLARQAIGTSTFQAAKDFLEALDRSEQFDCVVSDVRMPGMSGLDLMRHLKNRGA
jgi:FixJ family two-component response regulator